MVLAWLTEKSLRCPDCGTYYEEWDAAKGGHHHAYFPKAEFCMGCKAKEDQYEAMRINNDESGSGNLHGLQMNLTPNQAVPGLRSPMNGKPIKLIQQN